MIIEIHRGHVRLEVAGKIITIEGESYLPRYGSPDFVAYRNTIRCWDAPDQNPLTSAEIELVEQTLLNDFKAKNMTIEIE